MNIQLRGAVTNQPPLKILFILDTDNNKALDCGLQSYFFIPQSFKSTRSNLYIEGL
jgi:hypothetical protein